MYHYIRDLQNSRFPNIKGLTLENFIGQLEYLKKYYTIVSMQDCIDAYLGIKNIPKNACLLTFDDGLKDHFINVFPILNEMGFSGAFFPCVKPILKNIVLNVHKIHFILASTNDYRSLIILILELLAPFKKNYNLPDKNVLISKYAIPSRWDPAEIMFIKRLLQYGLPEVIRDKICLKLFNTLVSVNEKAFAKELYMSIKQIKLMVKSGMYIGGHSYSHKWLGELPEDKQEIEIKLTYEFLERIYNKKPINWAFTYPRRSKNKKTISILKKYNCLLGMSAREELTIIDNNNRYDIPRFDTNHFPFSNDSKIIKWTKLVLS